MSRQDDAANFAAWIEWLRDFVAAAVRFTEEDPIDVASDEERELVAIKAALYARALTLCEGALLLIENDRQLDFRVQARGVIEATMYLIALDSDPAFVGKMKDDDYKSRQSRVGLLLSAKDFNGSPDIRKELENFVAQGLQGAKSIQMGKLLDGSEFERLYRTYRDISGDAAHVSITSLNRHYADHVEGLATLTLHPALEDGEMHVTFTELGISMTIATLMMMKVKAKTALWNEFSTLLQRYQSIGRPETSASD